uniref:Uncharacterized protein n=1 Tax=Ammonifex degensii TaxID=42838 RepID=A0A7C1F3S0_9THEO
MEPIVIHIEVTIEDILYILQSRGTEIKNRWAYLDHLRKYLPAAIDNHIYDEVKYLTSSYIEQEQCPHNRRETYITGGYHFAVGEVWDDIREITVCLDCGKELPEESTESNTLAEETPF